MCSGGTCGSAPGISYDVPPNSGDFLAWFGGVDEFEEGTIEGDFVIPSCSHGQTILSFGFQNEPCLNANDFIQLQVDGNVVWNYDVDLANCNNLGALQLITLDFSTYADDASHNLLFTATTVEGSATSFTIDNIQLINESCTAEIICTYSIGVDYDCDTICADEIDCEGQCGGTATPGTYVRY